VCAALNLVTVARQPSSVNGRIQMTLTMLLATLAGEDADLLIGHPVAEAQVSPREQLVTTSRGPTPELARASLLSN
jgi:hypothetical protein